MRGLKNFIFGMFITTLIVGTVIAAVPSVTVVNPNDGSMKSGTFQLEATASDSDGYIVNVTFYHNNDGASWTLIDTNSSSSGNSYYLDWDTTSVSNGNNYLIRAMATDNDEEIKNDSSDLLFAIDNNQKPFVSLIFPTSGMTVNKIVTLNATATDPDGTISTVFFEYNSSSGWESIGQYASNNGDYYYIDWNTELIANNTYEIRVTATDDDSDTNTSTISGIIVDNLPNILPIVIINNPTGGETYNNTIELNATATDTDGSITNVTFEYNSGSEWESIGESASNVGDYYYLDWDTSLMENGANYRIRATATDNRTGTTTNPSDVFSIYNNHKPILSEDNANPASGTTPQDFTFSVKYTDSDNDSAKFVKVVIDGTEYEMIQGSGDPKNGIIYNITKQLTTTTLSKEYKYYFIAQDNNELDADNTDEKIVTVHPATYYTGNRIWQKGMAEDEYFWTPHTFSGFYYNLDTNEGGEKLTIKNIGSSIDKNDIIYETEPILVQFERSAFGHYYVIGFMADRYFAGYENGTIGDTSHNLLDEEILSRVLIDDDESQMIRSGTPLVLEEGYDFRVTEYAASGDDVMIGLFKDGENVDATILSEGQTYTYKKDMGSADKIPIIAIRVETVFRGMETSTIKIDGIFQISDNYLEIERGDEFGEMEIDTVSENGITMTNPGSVSLKKGNTFNLMGKINIEVGDSGTLRFAPTVDMIEPGTYELRGTVTEEADYTWTPLNFEGLLYDMDSGDGNESLKIERDDINDRNIDKGKLTYSTGTIDMSFEYSGWGTYDTIGFMGDKYFAGYRDNTIMTDGKSLMETGHLGKILIDEDEKHTLFVGNSLPLLEGYSLRIDEISRDGDSIMIALLKDGEEIESEITNEGKTYTYTKEIDKEDIPIIAIHFDKIFRGMETNSIFIKGIFQISGNFKLVEQGDTYGEMEVETVLENKITMENDDDISLSKDSDVSIMGDIKIKVADSGTVRFYPYQTIKVEPLQSLEIDIPANIYENEEFTIRVTSDNDEVEGASITFDDIEIGSTDSNGELTYTPAETGTFTVTASKSGYKSDSTETEVVYQPEALDIKFPLVVDKGESFMISITSEGSPLSGVSVMFGNQDLGTTPASGNITHISDEIGTFTVTASKSGYQEISKDIDIADPSARLVFSNLIIEPEEVEPRQMVNITVEAANFGTLREAETVILTINEDEECTREVTLDSGETTTLKFNVNRSKPGTYDVGIGERNGTFEVIGSGGIGAIGIAILGIIGILSAGAIVYSIAQGTLTFETITAKFQALEQTIRRLIEK